MFMLLSHSLSPSPTVHLYLVISIRVYWPFGRMSCNIRVFGLSSETLSSKSVKLSKMTRSVRFISIIVLTFVCVANGDNVLFLTGLPSPSHHIWNREITNSLSARGYNLTVLSIDVDPVKPSNVHYLQLNDIYEKFQIDYVKTLFDTKKKINPFKGAIEYHDLVYTICERMY